MSALAHYYRLLGCLSNLLLSLSVFLASSQAVQCTLAFTGSAPTPCLFGVTSGPRKPGAIPRLVGPTSGFGRDTASILMAAKETSTFEKVPDTGDDTPIPFLDIEGGSFIECYADSVATVDGVKYTIGIPCDYSVALCYFDEEDRLVPVELDEKLMDDVFPFAERIVEEEFGEELGLQRTPQTLTLVGELEEDEDEEDEDELEDMGDGEEEVEVLLSFEHRDKEFNLVRLLDPVLLVGKEDPDQSFRRILLTPEESDKLMPELETLFLDYHKDSEMTM